MTNPITNPEEALALLSELDQEIVQAGQSGGNRQERLEPYSPHRLSYEDKAANIQLAMAGEKAGHTKSATPDQDWPDMEEVESILSTNSDHVPEESLKTVLKGIVRYQQHLASYVEASFMEINASIETITRKVEFLGVPSTLKVPLAQEKERAVFTNPKTELRSYFLPGASPPTLKACRIRLVDIASNTPGDWIPLSDINALNPSVLAYLKDHWEEGTVKAKIGKTN